MCETTSLLKAIFEVNLAYLLLAQRLLNHEKKPAMFRLDIDVKTADFLMVLTLPQMLKLARTNRLLSRLRLEYNSPHIFSSERERI